MTTARSGHTATLLNNGWVLIVGGYDGSSELTTSELYLPPSTVFLVHGIAQDGGETGDLSGLARSLRDPIYGLDQTRFIIDAGFDFRHCANSTNCPGDCTIGGTPVTNINNGARLLGAYIDAHPPAGDVILIAYSMGGLIARDMIVNSSFSKHRVAALITLGTPHLGYPRLATDAWARCTSLAKQMFGDFRGSSSAGDRTIYQDSDGQQVNISTYLAGLNRQWSAKVPADLPPVWVSIAGSFCSDPVRTGSLGLLGCSTGSPQNDGVVCAQSASFNWNVPNRATPSLAPDYAHTDNWKSLAVFCGNWDGAQPALFNPPANGPVIQKIRQIVTSLP